MRRIFSVAALAFALVASAATGFAKDFTVPANKTSGLTFYYVYGESNCEYGSKPTFKVTSPPEHGVIVGKWMKLNIKDHIPKDCQGRPVYGTAIFYTPNKGFHGVDHATVAFGRTEIADHLPMPSKSMWLTINVK